MAKESIKSKTSLKIQNIVATASLGKDVPLTKLVKAVQNTEYNPEQFPGLVLRVKQPKSAVLVFSSGNLVCTGTIYCDAPCGTSKSCESGSEAAMVDPLMGSWQLENSDNYKADAK